MSHVTRRQVRDFLARGVSSEAFEAHVDACPACAAVLARGAQSAVAGAQPQPAHLHVLMGLAATAAVLLVALPRAAPPPPTPHHSAAVIEARAEPLAGVSDAGAPDVPLPPTVLAALDAGGLLRR